MTRKKFDVKPEQNRRRAAAVKAALMNEIHGLLRKSRLLKFEPIA